MCKMKGMDNKFPMWSAHPQNMQGVVRKFILRPRLLRSRKAEAKSVIFTLLDPMPSTALKTHYL
jgi:hypothetical protein